ncbi:MAG: DUF58 domain-containing protein [Thermoguttaceae bacterium]|nr:DUF58 domain-containing protein [Thermoguttaceae bacterium]MDW8037409.1 DUF58 domain-containing protein [Thermoguttaceae bacterium]
MTQSILSRYLDPEVLSRMARRRLQPRGLVLGNLAGAHKSPLSGFAVEFAGHREYVWGDDPKHIDWRIYFRRDRYFIKQYEMETNLVCHLVLDCSASMRYGQGPAQKLRYASQMLAHLAYAVLRQSDKVSLAVFDDRVRDFIPPTNSMAQLLRITQVLDQTQPVAKTDMAGCLGELAGRMKRREIVMIFSDFFTELGPLEKALQRFRYNRHEVVLFQVMHHDELAFELEGMTKFVGLEVPEELLAQPEAIRRAYLAAVERHNRQLEEICLRNRIERVLVDTSQDMAGVLVDYLNSRNRRRWRR